MLMYADACREKMQMRKQRQRTGEQRSKRMVRRTCLNGKDVIKKQLGGFKLKKTIYFFLFLPKAVFEHVYISTVGVELRNLHDSHTLGCDTPAVIHT
jgi:hypothetical protein